LLAPAPAQPERCRIVQGAIDQLLLLAQPGTQVLECPSRIIRPVGLSRLQASPLEAQAQAGLLQRSDHGRLIE